MKTTKKDYDRFKKSARYYQELLSLGDWNVCFEHRNLKSNYAEIIFEFASRSARITLTTEVSDRDADGFDPWKHGKHEVCELLIAELTFASKFYYNNDRVNEFTHAIIRRLEKALP